MASPALAVVNGIVIHRIMLDNDTLGWFVKDVQSGRSWHDDYDAQLENVLDRARTAWARQLEAELPRKQMLEEVAELQQTQSTLVWWSDSMRAGNCDPGTRAWLEELGWYGRPYLRLEELVPYADEWRVANVIRTVLSACRQ